MRSVLVVLSALTLTAVSGQQKFKFTEYLNPVVQVAGDSLVHAFAGGLNNPQFSEIDLNLDGIRDLVIFDRDGNDILPFLRLGGTANPHFSFAPEYISSFPPLENIVKLVDYNCDGKADIFCKVPLGLGVYENKSTSDTLKFEWALGADNHLRTLFPNGQTSNIYVMQIDYPHIGDVDGDGAVDILAFSLFGSEVYFYKNISPDSCGLEYELVESCYGQFREDGSSNSIHIGDCLPSSIGGEGGELIEQPDDIQHAGSTLLSVDLNNSGLPDLILGDISFSGLTAAFNTGAPDSAYMSSQIENWGPDTSTPVDLYVFPAIFHFDMNFDGLPDFVAAPNSLSSKNRDQVWVYPNSGTAANPVYSRTDTAYMVGDMIDLGEGAFPVFVDLNGDGKQDIVIGNRGAWIDSGNYKPELWYLQNTSSGGTISFELITKTLVSLTALNNPLSLYPTFGDLDDDGDQDLIIGLEDGTLAYFENTGTSTNPIFSLSSTSFGGIDVGLNAAPELYDVDGDGSLDLLIGEKLGTVNYYHWNGAAFQLETDRFGGIDRDHQGQQSGYSMPRMYDFNGQKMLMVGSEFRGVAQFDSLTTIIQLPQEITGTIGAGTTPTTTTDETPFGATSRTGRNQMLYLASELLAEGMNYGQIEKIEFQVSSNQTSGSLTNGASVRMKNVNMSQLSGLDDNMEEVYNYTMAVAPGWNDIRLQTPFIWDGQSDLLVEICFSRNFPYIDNSVYATDVGFPAHAYGNRTNWNSNTHDGCLMPYKATSTLRPNIRITQRPVTPLAGVLIEGGHRTNADFADLDGDGYPEAIVGNYRGGVMILKGSEYSIGVFEEQLRSEAIIYPNPTDGPVRIELDGHVTNAQYVIYDLNGRKMKGGVMSENPLELDLSTLNPGMYLIQVVDGAHIHYGKIILR